MRSFPGGVGLTDLRAYDGGGTPHLHLVCSETYVVIGGSGAVETLSQAGPARIPLEPGTVVTFAPGTIHRAVNDGDLHVVVVMDNSGLPEAGDAVMTFPPEVLATRESYDAVADLTVPGNSPERRRERALEGYSALLRAAQEGDLRPFETFLRAAVRLIAPKLDDWRDVVERSVGASLERSLQRLRALRAHDIGDFASAGHETIEPSGARTPGMCGLLVRYDAIRGGRNEGAE